MVVERMKLGRSRLGQLCLVGCVILNFFALMFSLKVTNLEAKLNDLKDDERYFIINEQAVSSEQDYRVNLHTSLNTLKILRRLAANSLSQSENQTLLEDETLLQLGLDRCLRRLVAGTYLMANEPEPGENLDEKFASMTDEQLHILVPKFQKQAIHYVTALKKDMVDIMQDIPFWRRVYSSVLIISTIIVIVANFLIFTARNSAGRVAHKS